jgi:hypothetical protein
METPMVLGMSLSTFTAFHVLLSLIGIGSGFLVLYGLLVAKRFDGATAIFLLTTVLTSATGFLFPFEHLLPSHILGIISLACSRLRSWRVMLVTWLAPGDRPTWYAPCWLFI